MPALLLCPAGAACAQPSCLVHGVSPASSATKADAALASKAAHAATMTELRATNATLPPRAQMREATIRARAGRASFEAWREAMARPGPTLAAAAAEHGGSKSRK